MQRVPTELFSLLSFFDSMEEQKRCWKITLRRKACSRVNSTFFANMHLVQSIADKNTISDMLCFLYLDFGTDCRNSGLQTLRTVQLIFFQSL